ncbi:MAG: nickel pincer cofactor biosynthesis protein LarB [Ignavibacteriales bacterium]|nr:nickel pincer cofactor biosynthesis protein LarB [Ignavibacteriales bacterium]
MSDLNHERLEILEQFARLDVHRRERTGIPEAIFAEGKTPDQVTRMLDSLAEKSGYALATRVSEVCAQYALDHLNSKLVVQHNRAGRTVVVRLREYEPKSTGGKVAILAAGTSDLPVAEEAKVTAVVMGCEVFSFYDVGVAGIHRLLEPVETILQKEISAAVVVAGMEGALPSVVRGLVPIPVIGVPASVGYGYGGKGEAALMSMLQSCSPGMTVVNIDNGFGAGATAALIANHVAASRVK